MDLSLKRRSLISGGLLGAGALLGKLLPSSVFAQTPNSADTSTPSGHPVHGGSMTMGDVDNSRNGFDPQAVLTDWEVGKVSQLPDGSSGGNKKARTTAGEGKQRVSLPEDRVAYCH